MTQISQIVAMSLAQWHQAPSFQSTHMLLYKRLRFRPSNHFLARRQVSKWERQQEGDAAEGTGAKDVADAAHDAEADEMTVCYLPPTNRDKDVERAGSYSRDRQDSSHRHHPGVTINQQCPRSIL